MKSVHIRHFKKHRNILYTLVVILLGFQIALLGSFSYYLEKIRYEQDLIKGGVDDFQKATRANIEELSNELVKQRNELSSEIAYQTTLLNAQIDARLVGSDFSKVVEDVIQGVVTVSTDVSSATGFVINPEGYVVTNSHVVSPSQYIKVISYDGVSYSASLVGKDSTTDLALLKIEGSFRYLVLADSDEVQIGEKAIAIGNPLGLSFTVTEGIVSAVKRKVQSSPNSYIQTDVTLNPGNSGGPLINKNGQVIGINNFKIGNAEGLGFALESNVIRETIGSISSSALIGNA